MKEDGVSNFLLVTTRIGVIEGHTHLTRMVDWNMTKLLVWQSMGGICIHSTVANRLYNL